MRHAPTVRVTGEHIMEEKKKESLFKFAKLAAFEREACLVWIATPPSKMFVIKVDDDSEITGRRQELSTCAKYVYLLYPTCANFLIRRFFLQTMALFVIKGTR